MWAVALVWAGLALAQDDTEETATALSPPTGDVPPRVGKPVPELTDLPDHLALDHELTPAEFQLLSEAIDRDPGPIRVVEHTFTIELTEIPVDELPIQAIQRLPTPVTAAGRRDSMDTERRNADERWDGQEFGMRCGFAAGLAGAISPPGRDWDLSTPGPAALSWSPVLSHSCWAADVGLLTLPWVSVDLAPGLRHSYGGLGVRAPLLATAAVGTGFWLGAYERLGPMVITNGAAVGVGARLIVADELRSPGFEVRTFAMPGADPSIHLWVLGRFSYRVLGRDRDLQRRGRSLGVSVDPYTKAMWGLEMGTVIGLRAKLDLGDDEPEIGVRMGLMTDFFAADILQPTAMAVVDLPVQSWVQVMASGGVTVRDRKARPTGGVAVQIDPPWSPVEAHVGPRFTHDGSRLRPGLDAGVAMVWGRHVRRRHDPPRPVD